MTRRDQRAELAIMQRELHVLTEEYRMLAPYAHIRQAAKDCAAIIAKCRPLEAAIAKQQAKLLGPISKQRRS